MKPTVEVTLHGKNGQRQTAIRPRKVATFETQWASVASKMATDTPQPETSEPETQPTYSVVMPLSDPNAVRCYRINKDGSQSSIYKGESADDLDALCQVHAQVSGCVVQKHTADSVKFFKPKPKTDLQALLAEVNAIMGVDNE